MTQEQAADLLGVGKSTISMWETGKRTPTRAKYEAIADVFNVDLDYLYGKTSEKRHVYYDEEGNRWSRENLTPEQYSLIASLSEDELKTLVDFIKFKKSGN